MATAHGCPVIIGNIPTVILVLFDDDRPAVCVSSNPKVWTGIAAIWQEYLCYKRIVLALLPDDAKAWSIGNKPGPWREASISVGDAELKSNDIG